MKPNFEWFDAGSWIGRQQAFAIIANKCSAAQAECLKQAKQSRVYEKFGLNWNDFCPKHVGISRATADRIIEQYDEFGAAYFKLSSLARISSEAYRQIAPAVTENAIQIDGEAVAISEANAAKIRAHIRSLRNALALERQRTDPSLQELYNRLDLLVKEFDKHTTPNLATVQREYLADMYTTAIKKLQHLARCLDRIMHPNADAEPRI